MIQYLTIQQQLGEALEEQFERNHPHLYHVLSKKLWQGYCGWEAKATPIEHNLTESKLDEARRLGL